MLCHAPLPVACVKWCFTSAQLYILRLLLHTVTDIWTTRSCELQSGGSQCPSAPSQWPFCPLLHLLNMLVSPASWSVGPEAVLDFPSLCLFHLCHTGRAHQYDVPRSHSLLFGFSLETQKMGCSWPSHPMWGFDEITMFSVPGDWRTILVIWQGGVGEIEKGRMPFVFSHVGPAVGGIKKLVIFSNALELIEN